MFTRLFRTCRWTALGGLMALALLPAAVQAQSPAVTIDNATGQTLGNPPFTLGFSFTVNSDINVIALGFFDDSQDGLVESHDVGIWDSGGNLLASSTVASGTANPLTNQFRYVSIAPLLLSAGQSYAIGALFASGNDPLIFPGAASNFATDPSITFNQNRFVTGGSLSNPTNSVGNDAAYFGPNMLLGSPVPEPGSMALLTGLGVSGLLAVRRMRRRVR